MPKLSNDVIRKESIESLLKVMGFDVGDLNIASTEGLFSFGFQNCAKAGEFSTKMSKIIQKDGDLNSYTTKHFIDMIEDEVNDASCLDLTELDDHKEVCLEVLSKFKKLDAKKLGATFVFSEKSGQLELTLTSHNYASWLNILKEPLKYPNLSFSEKGKLVFNIKNYLKDEKISLVMIEGLKADQGLVFLNSSLLESNRLLYSSKEMPNDQLEVTPYFFVPQAPSPADYYFLLDVSGSMRYSLPRLKECVLDLAEHLFEFQPKAKLNLSTFSNEICELGSYGQNDWHAFGLAIGQIEAHGGTPLYKATCKMLEKIKSSIGSTNVLLFTDGANDHDETGWDNYLLRLVNEVKDSELTTTRTKFNIFSYGCKQHELMMRVAKTFSSEIIETSDLEFLNAQKNPELMKRWAASRELFLPQIIIKNKLGQSLEKEYSVSFDQSGQVVALKPVTCKKGDEIELVIRDGAGKIVCSDKHTTVEVVPQIKNAELIGTFGLNSNNQLKVQKDVEDVSSITPTI